jgi:hypothetical protein
VKIHSGKAEVIFNGSPVTSLLLSGYKIAENEGKDGRRIVVPLKV